MSDDFDPTSQNLCFYRPHDRVPLKEMKVDWHACLNNKVGFKVTFSWVF